MLIVGVNKQFRRVRQSEMHKTWEAGKLTGRSSALKFAISYVFRFQIVFITIFFFLNFNGLFFGISCNACAAYALFTARLLFGN